MLILSCENRKSLKMLNRAGHDMISTLERQSFLIDSRSLERCWREASLRNRHRLRAAYETLGNDGCWRSRSRRWEQSRVDVHVASKTEVLAVNWVGSEEVEKRLRRHPCYWQNHVFLNLHCSFEDWHKAGKEKWWT